MSIYHDYKVEQCLKTYEEDSVYGVGFIGEGEEGSDEYYSKYGRLNLLQASVYSGQDISD